MKTKSSLLIAVLAAFSLPVLAQTAPAKDPAATPGIDKRQANQDARIQQGVQSGQLTQREAGRLEKGQERVQKMEDKAKADGVVTKKERTRIQHTQNVESKRIYRQKHDRQHDLNHDGKKDRPGRK